MNQFGRVARGLSQAAAGVALLSVPSLAAGQVSAYRPILLSDDALVGAPAGVTYSGTSSGPTLAAGQVALRGNLAGTGVTNANDSALFAGTPAGLAMVARRGTQAPGLAAGVNYFLLGEPCTAGDGRIAFSAFLSGSGVNSGNDTALFVGPAAAPTLYVREGGAAFGLPAGVTLTGMSDPAITRTGQITFQAGLGGTGVTSSNNRAVYAGPLASPSVIARTGSQAAGLAAGITYSDLGTIANTSVGLTDAGTAPFAATLSGTGVTASNNRALYVGAPSGTTLVARTGNAAPGLTGVTMNLLPGLVMGGQGQVVFPAGLAGTGVTSDNNTALFAGPAGSPALLVRQGSAAPGAPAGYVLSSVGSNLKITDGGRVSFSASLTLGSNPAPVSAMYTGMAGNLNLIARGGDHAPDTAASVTYYNLNDLVANDAGVVAYTVTLRDSAIVGVDGLSGALFAGPANAPHLVARNGDPFDVNGTSRTISSISCSTIDGDGQTGLGEDGQIVFGLGFTDGTSGVFSAVVPEPGSAGGICLAWAGLLARRRRPRRPSATV